MRDRPSPTARPFVPSARGVRAMAVGALFAAGTLGSAAAVATAAGRPVPVLVQHLEGQAPAAPAPVTPAPVAPAPVAPPPAAPPVLEVPAAAPATGPDLGPRPDDPRYDLSAVRPEESASRPDDPGASVAGSPAPGARTQEPQVQEPQVQRPPALTATPQGGPADAADPAARTAPGSPPLVADDPGPAEAAPRATRDHDSRSSRSDSRSDEAPRTLRGAVERLDGPLGRP